MVIGAVGPLTVNSLDLLFKSAAVRGWYSGTAPDSEDTLNFSVLNKIASMIEVYPFEKAQEAYQRMMSGKPASASHGTESRLTVNSSAGFRGGTGYSSSQISGGF